MIDGMDGLVACEEIRVVVTGMESVLGGLRLATSHGRMDKTLCLSDREKGVPRHSS